MKRCQKLKIYHRIPAEVRAGCIEKVYFDPDNEESPFMVWINGEKFELAEEVVEFREPEVGDWLVLGDFHHQTDGERPYIDGIVMPADLFRSLYSNTCADSRKAASPHSQFN